jgi:hypothetical protein
MNRIKFYFSCLRATSQFFNPNLRKTYLDTKIKLKRKNRNNLEFLKRTNDSKNAKIKSQKICILQKKLDSYGTFINKQ